MTHERLVRRQRKSFIRDVFRTMTQRKMEDFQTSFSQLARSFHQMARPKKTYEAAQMDQIILGVTEKVCKKCSNYQSCWEKEDGMAKDAVCAITDTVLQNKPPKETVFLDAFQDSCVHLGQLMRETQQGVGIAQANLLWYNRLVESREAMADQFQEMSEIFGQLIKPGDEQLYEIEQKKEKKLRRLLARNGVVVYELLLLNRQNQRQEIHILARVRKGETVSTKEVSALLVKVFGETYHPSEKTPHVVPEKKTPLIFIKDESFHVLTGMAKRQKDGQRVSGDNYSILNLENGKMVMILSDGMGYGEKAGAESARFLNLLEQFLDAGISCDSAIRLLNAMLVQNCDSRMFTTLDMTMICLYSGLAKMVKIGSSTTFIRRKGWVEAISATSLPVGIVNHMDVETVTKKLYDDNYVIMVTDGVLEAIPGEEKEASLKGIIEHLESRNPQGMAEELIKKVQDGNELVRDDMMVLVCGFWKKSSC